MSSYTKEQVCRLLVTLEGAGFTSRDITNLGQHKDLSDFLGILRGTHEIKAKYMFSRRVTVDRSLSPEQALTATGRKQYINGAVVSTMPNGEGDEVEVFFVKRDRQKWDVHLNSLGLKPCDPHTLAKVNQDDPTFADSYPNGTFWKDGNGKWCFATFLYWFGERDVYVGRNDSVWGGDWWFAGVRK